METLRSLWREMVAPSIAGESPYLWMLIAIGHAVLGAALAHLVPPGWPAWLVVPLAYWLVKEGADLRRGGSVADGVVDAGFVALGTFYGAGWWPVVVLVFSAGGAVLRSKLLEVSE